MQHTVLRPWAWGHVSDMAVRAQAGLGRGATAGGVSGTEGRSESQGCRRAALASAGPGGGGFAMQMTSRGRLGRRGRGGAKRRAKSADSGHSTGTGKQESGRAEAARRPAAARHAPGKGGPARGRSRGYCAEDSALHGTALGGANGRRRRGRRGRGGIMGAGGPAPAPCMHAWISRAREKKKQRKELMDGGPGRRGIEPWTEVAFFFFSLDFYCVWGGRTGCISACRRRRDRRRPGRGHRRAARGGGQAGGSQRGSAAAAEARGCRVSGAGARGRRMGQGGRCV